MSQSSFAVQICDRGINTDKAWRIAWMGSIPCLAFLLFAIGFLRKEELDASIPFYVLVWCSFIFMGLIGILRIVDAMQEYGVIQSEEFSMLYVNDRSIEYRTYFIPLSSVLSVTLKIITKERGRSRGENNLFRIRTKERDLNLELVISNKNDLLDADKMASFLKSKNIPVDYERRVTLSI